MNDHLRKVRSHGEQELSQQEVRLNVNKRCVHIMDSLWIVCTLSLPRVTSQPCVNG